MPLDQPGRNRPARIAIHHRPGSFSDGWIACCRADGIPYAVVDCYAGDIVDAVRDCDALMWHWSHAERAAGLFARQLTHALEAMGKLVFPSISTAWHYDDKIGQAYLLRAIGAPAVPTVVFYDPAAARAWADRATFPVVFKLRGGTGSSNVKLVRSAAEANRIIASMFGAGIRDRGHAQAAKDRVSAILAARAEPGQIRALGRKVIAKLRPGQLAGVARRDRGYVYFQDFIPGLTHDMRVVVVGGRCWAFRRAVRDGDFRASGSSRFDHDRDAIPPACVSLAFDIVEKLGAQCLAFDMVLKDGAPLVLEMSYAFSLKGYKGCEGYWRRDLEWVPGALEPERYMVEDVLAALAVQGSMVEED